VTSLRLAIVTSHPIQYYAPLFRSLARSGEVLPRVFFTWSQTEGGRVPDVEFGRAVSWDIPLLCGYEHEFVKNIARRPGTDHFWGLNTPGLAAAIEAWKPDALLVIGWNSWSHLRALMHFKGRLPVFFRGDSTLLDPRPALRSALRRRLLAWVYRHIDVALAVGANNADYFRWCGPGRVIRLVPHAVDTARFAADAQRHETQARQWRREYGIAEAARVLVFAGKLIPKKDPVGLLRAFSSAVAMDDEQVHLVFVGEGALKGELEAQAAGRRNVHFRPFQNQQAMPAVYRLGDVYVLPSLGPGETWGLAMNEAMATGSLVIASDRVGGARDVVEHGRTGWIFRAGDHDALVRHITTLKKLDTAQWSAMKAASAERSQRWSIESATTALKAAVLSGVRVQ
jgi:glycosyltransferase involved in cell wall biosynthesis